MMTFNTLEEVKAYAKQQLENTDYSVLPDVNLSNKQEFVGYRSILRLQYFNPNFTPFPIEPTPIWNDSESLLVSEPNTDLPTQ